ncbi:MAG: ammonia-forming cytochrome c nitrite reductase subunit c552 [Luteococcus sp.]|uniref:ammonia-forming cytochrome c nitrite reductase subunit c552 n=1 Tax=Luteococcus sp. TaxID=1969402 RepID=UPI00264A1BA3|nr:ammonia-forming cytochrome c nitrite reductase subunit c552 [Luteococcus sp.]MDN5564941.1 ammonia-forming cytochrome c nitrite reductase subunit c552 [Luteococcus sp.]
MSTAAEHSTVPPQEPKRRTKLILGALVLASLLATLVIAALLVDVAKKQTEAQDTYFKAVELTDTTVDPAVWGKNFPIQYEMYKKTTEMEPTEFGGSTPTKHVPDAKDPRTVVAAQELDREPRLKRLWAGYAFATDYREARGHAYMLEDQLFTKRMTDFPQPGACINCHASTYTVFKEIGGGDAMKGFDETNHAKYMDISGKFKHPISCIDCHDPKTMALRVTKPAFINGIKELKASEGVKNYDVNKDATPQEMRSFVCGQCHVEYYFKGDKKTLTFPWSKGLTIENEYQDSADHVDWTHKLTGMPGLKAQHPDFETWSNGIHAKAGVSCADCHMPYKRQGATKVSEHQVRSPMLDVNASCQTCHKASEKEMKERVSTIQNRFHKTMDETYTAVDELIADIEAAQKSGVAKDRLDQARLYQRKASFYLDYSESENSNGFHAPAYSQQILAEATNAARQGQLALLGKSSDPKPLPLSEQGEKNWAAAKAKAKAAAASASPAPAASATPVVPGTTPSATPTR